MSADATPNLATALALAGYRLCLEQRFTDGRLIVVPEDHAGDQRPTGVITDPADLPDGMLEQIKAGADASDAARQVAAQRHPGHEVSFRPLENAGYQAQCSCGWRDASSHPLGIARAVAAAHQEAEA